MRKTTKYARKSTNSAKNGMAFSLAEAKIFADVQRDIEQFSLEASLHAWAGNNARATIYLAGNLFFIVLGGAMCSGISHDDPDLDAVRHGVDAISELRHQPDGLEKHRPAIQAGILAVGRALPRCDPRQIVHSAVHLMTLLNRGGSAVQRFEAQLAV